MKQDCSGSFFRHYLHYRFNGVVDKLNTIKGDELKSNINLRLTHPQALVPFNPLKFMQVLYWFIQINNLANPRSGLKLLWSKKDQEVPVNGGEKDV